MALWLRSTWDPFGVSVIQKSVVVRVWVVDKDEKNPDMTAAWIRAETDEGIPVLSHQLSSSSSREDGSQYLEDWGKTGLLFMLSEIVVST